MKLEQHNKTVLLLAPYHGIRWHYIEKSLELLAKYFGYDCEFRRLVQIGVDCCITE